MTAELDAREIAVVRRGVSYLALSGWMTKPERAPAVSAMKKLGTTLIGEAHWMREAAAAGAREGKK